MDSCQDCPTFVEQDALIDKLTDEIRQLKAAAREVIKGQDGRHSHSSGQVFVDVGSLDALSRAVSDRLNNGDAPGYEERTAPMEGSGPLPPSSATKQGPRCRDHDIVDCIECAIDCLKALPTVESGQSDE